MDIKDLLGLVVILVALPSACWYVIKIFNWFQCFKKKNNKQPQKELSAIQNRVSLKIPTPKIMCIHMLAFLQLCFFIYVLIETMTTVPQAGFNGPAPLWVAGLISMPLGGFATQWTWLSMADTCEYINPEDSKKPYPRKALAMFFLIFGMIIPWMIIYIGPRIENTL